MKTVYIADDGKQFDDEFDCQNYEWQLNHKNFATIEFFDKDGNTVIDVFSEKAYEKTEQVNIYNSESVEELQEFAADTGFGSYEDITEPGIWCFRDEGFVKVANVQEKKPIGAEYEYIFNR